MPGHRLRRAHGEARRALTESAMYRGGLGPIAERSGGGVRIDVLHLRGIEARIEQRIHHGAARAIPVIGRRRDVEGIAAHAEAEELGIDLRTARPRLIVVLEHHRAGAVTHDETVAVAVPGAARPLRIIVSL